MKLKSTILLFLPALIFISCEGNPLEQEDYTDEGEILFIRHKNGLSEICSIIPDGSDFQIIVSNQMNTGEYSGSFAEAIWTGNKSKIVISGGPGSVSDSRSMWIYSSSGKPMKQLDSGGSLFQEKTENKMVYSIWESQTVYLINTKTYEKRVFYENSMDLSISFGGFSNDGKFGFGVVSKRVLDNEDNPSWEGQVGRINLETWETSQIYSDDHIWGIPRWSPDESGIAFKWKSDEGVRNIKLLDIESQSLYSLTNQAMSNPFAFTGKLCWSPDGKKIAYSNVNPHNGWPYNEYSDIFILDIDSGEIDTLTFTAVDSVTSLIMDWK